MTDPGFLKCIKTKLFHFYRMFKNGRGRGLRGQPQDHPVLNDLAYAIKGVSLSRTVSTE